MVFAMDCRIMTYPSCRTQEAARMAETQTLAPIVPVPKLFVRT